MLIFRLWYAELIPLVIFAFKYLTFFPDEKENKAKEDAVFPADLSLNWWPSYMQSSSARAETTLSKCKVALPWKRNRNVGPL